LHKVLTNLAARRRSLAPVFAALGDPTRLSLVAKLCDGQPCSIAQLTRGSKLSRQAVTKHLHVLEQASLVHSARAGRESLFELNPEPIKDLEDYLRLVSGQWDKALERLRAFVEDP
jgi:DNA-binding transcriptional ArsR family regulator